jgi:glycosyltransferase involved in cell wall biosynthesis
VPVYNGEKFIAATLESVRAQYREGFELVIVEGGSTDRTLEIVREFAEVFPIRLITLDGSGNWVAKTNIGLREARGVWACFLHHDDLWLPGRIARLWGEMETAKGALILHNAMFVGPDGNGLGPWTCPFSAGDVASDEFVEHLLIQNFIAINSPVFRRKAVLESGGLDEALPLCADWDIWLRLGASGPVRFIAETLGAYRIHDASLTAARKLLANEWEEQLSTVFFRHFNNWTGSGRRRASVERAARASIAVNSSLAAASRGKPTRLSAALFELLALGPSGWRRYLRDSRIVQRVNSRLRVQRLARH